MAWLSPTLTNLNFRNILACKSSQANVIIIVQLGYSLEATQATAKVLNRAIINL